MGAVAVTPDSLLFGKKEKAEPITDSAFSLSKSSAIKPLIPATHRAEGQPVDVRSNRRMLS